ncbi:MAG: hypothetical protein FJ299_12195 [Planctomycetes bacterium]|nr:hypothetical protein [Planctomycetota bacterium]
MARLGPRDDAELGRLGEELAARWLARRGARIAARGARIAGVEIDLVAHTRSGPALVEVKTARLPWLEGSRGLDPRFRPGLRVGWARLRRLRRARAAAGKDFRIDLLEVALAPDGSCRIRQHVDLRRPLPAPGAGRTLEARACF